MTTNRQPQEQAYPGPPDFTATLNLCGDRWLRWYIFTRVGPSQRFCWGLAADVAVTGAWQNGYVIPSTEPGLRVALNEAVAREHPYEGDELSLEMLTEPVR